MASSAVVLAAIASALGLGGCGDATTPVGPPPGPVPTALEIRGLPEEPLEIGTVVQLTGWAIFSDGASGQVDPLWSSSAPEVASVDGRGFVFAHAAGETRITATLGPASAEAGVAVAPVNPNLYPGDAAFRSTSECGEWRVEPPHTGAQDEIRPGAWLVGAQIAPGAYRADADYLCLWLRLAAFGGGQEDVVEDGLVETRAGAELTVTIDPSDAGFYSDAACGVWTRVEDP